MKKARLIPFFLMILHTAFSQQLHWKFKTEGPVHSTPVAFGESVFAASEDSYLYRVEAGTGKLIWKVKPGGPLGADPVIDNELVFANSRDGFLYAMEVLTGKLKWKFRTEGEKQYDAWDYYLSSPVIDEDMLYFGSGDGHLYCLDKNNGKLHWKFKTGDVIHATPVVFDHKVFVGSFDGFLYAIDKKTGEAVWKFDTVGDTHFPKGEVQKAVTISDSMVYFGSRDYNIYVLDAGKGTGKWNMKEKGSWIIAPPEVNNKDIYFGTSDSHVFYAMDAVNGDIKWKIPLNMRVYGSSVSDKGVVYFGCFNGKLYAADQKTGKVLWHYQTEGSIKNYNVVYGPDDKFRPDFEIYGDDYMKGEKKIMEMGAILSSVVLSNNILYFSSTDGYVYALRP